mgnify:FL=1|jgi:hypothetical protein
MKDLREMIEALNKQISWEQEELGKELARVAEKANEDRETSYYLADVERVVNEAKDTQARIHELEIKRDLLRYALEEF